MNTENEKALLGDDESNARLEALEKLVEKAKANAGKYAKIKSKIYKGRMAPQGSLFFGVVIKDKRNTYKNVILLNCNGKDDDTEQLLYNELYTGLCRKYKINED
jgi:hypothetical protein